MNILRFINIVDLDGRLSFTNMIVLVVLGRILFATSVGFAEVAVLCLALLNHALSRILSYKEALAKIELESKILPNLDDITRVIAKVEELGGKVSALNMAIGLTKNR